MCDVWCCELMCVLSGVVSWCVCVVWCCELMYVLVGAVS